MSAGPPMKEGRGKKIHSDFCSFGGNVRLCLQILPLGHCLCCLARPAGAWGVMGDLGTRLGAWLGGFVLRAVLPCWLWVLSLPGASPSPPFLLLLPGPAS